MTALQRHLHLQTRSPRCHVGIEGVSCIPALAQTTMKLVERVSFNMNIGGNSHSHSSDAEENETDEMQNESGLA